MPVELTGAEWVEGPPQPRAVGITEGNFMGDPNYGGQFTESSYPVLSSGDRDFWQAGQAVSKVGSPRGSDVFNATTLRLDVVRPPDAQCVVIDYLFASENPVGTGMFLAEWGASTWTSDGHGNISAPNSLIRQINSDHIYYSDVVTTDYQTFHHWNPKAGPFRFRGTARMTTAAVLPQDGNSLYLTVAALDGSDEEVGGDTAVAIEGIHFYTEPHCADESTTHTWWSLWGGDWGGLG